MRYILTTRLTQTTDGDPVQVQPFVADIPGDPEEAWKRRIFRLREQRMHRSPDDLMSIEMGHADGIWWIEFSDKFIAWSVGDGKHVEICTSTRLEYEAAA